MEERVEYEMIKPSFQSIMLTVMEEDQSLDEVNATFKDLDSLEEEFHVPLEHKRRAHGEDVKQVVSIHELPSPYGCRSVATKTCTKVPMTVANKEPYEKCKQVMMLNHSILIIVLLYKFIKFVT